MCRGLSVRRCEGARGGTNRMSEVAKENAAPLGLPLGFGECGHQEPRWARLLTAQSCLPLPPSHPWLPSPLLPHSHLRASAPPGPLPLLCFCQHVSPLTEHLRLYPVSARPSCALTLVSTPPEQGLSLLSSLLSPQHLESD